MSKLKKILPFILGGTFAVVGLTGGIIGLTAKDGKDGKAGPTGENGAQGLQGPAGTNGNDGAQGNTGPRGPQGPAGPTGANGTDGAPGLISRDKEIHLGKKLSDLDKKTENLDKKTENLDRLDIPRLKQSIQILKRIVSDLQLEDEDLSDEIDNAKENLLITIKTLAKQVELALAVINSNIIQPSITSTAKQEDKDKLIGEISSSYGKLGKTKPHPLVKLLRELIVNVNDLSDKIKAYKPSVSSLLQLAIISQYRTFEQLEKSDFYKKYKKNYDDAIKAFIDDESSDKKLKNKLIAEYQLAKIQNVFDDKSEDLSRINKRWSDLKFKEDLKTFKIKELTNIITEPSGK